MIFPSMIPRDANGLVCGAWRLVHENPAFTGELGVVPFKNGTSVHPVAGALLSRLSAVVGHVLFVEQWVDLPRGFRMPEGHTAKVPESCLAKLQVAPWRKAKAAAELEELMDSEPSIGTGILAVAGAPESLADMPRADLVALCGLHDVEIDKRWGTPKIIAALQGAGITGA